MPTNVFPAVLRRASATVATAGALMALAAAPAAAHDELLSTTPQEGAVLETAPEQIELTFSGAIMDIGNEVRVMDSTGESVTAGEPELDGTRVIQPMTNPGAQDETYRVVWRVVSSDGHPIDGTFSYEVGDGADTVTTPGAGESPAAPDNAEAQNTDAESSSAGTPMWVVGAAGAAMALAVVGLAAWIARRRQG